MRFSEAFYIDPSQTVRWAIDNHPNMTKLMEAGDDKGRVRFNGKRYSVEHIKRQLLKEAK